MGRKKILIADDNRINRHLLRAQLRKHGDYELREATNGKEALELVEREAPDLILMDLMMPEIDGWEATRRILALSDLTPNTHFAPTRWSIVNTGCTPHRHNLRCGPEP